MKKVESLVKSQKEKNINNDLLIEEFDSVDTTKNIRDPCPWTNISTTLRGLLVEKYHLKLLI